MAKFEKVSKFMGVDINMPVRKTAKSAGYDFEVAEDIVIPAYETVVSPIAEQIRPEVLPVDLTGLGVVTKMFKAKPTLVSTGMKCHLADDEYLELSIRSSCPLKYWLVLANGVGIIDADYCDNPDNEGEIFFQLINLSTVPIALHKGDIIGQGIIHKYIVTEDDIAEGERVGGFGSTTL